MHSIYEDQVHICHEELSLAAIFINNCMGYYLFPNGHYNLTQLVFLILYSGILCNIYVLNLHIPDMAEQFVSDHS